MGAPTTRCGTCGREISANIPDPQCPTVAPLKRTLHQLGIDLAPWQQKVAEAVTAVRLTAALSPSRHSVALTAATKGADALSSMRRRH